MKTNQQRTWLLAGFVLMQHLVFGTAVRDERRNKRNNNRNMLELYTTSTQRQWQLDDDGFMRSDRDELSHQSHVMDGDEENDEGSSYKSGKKSAGPNGSQSVKSGKKSLVADAVP
jgi:hypothetical protein